MRAQSKIWISIAAALAVSVVIAFFAFSIVREMSLDFARYQGYGEIINKASALNILIGNALKAEPNPRQMQQIGQVRRTLNQALESISASNAREESLIRQLRRNNQELGPLIEQLFEPMAGPSDRIDSERKNLLTSQLWIKVRSVTDDVDRLMQTSEARIIAAQAKTSLVVLILIGVVILSNALIYFFSSRSIVKAQEALRESESRFRSLFDSMTEGVALHELVYDDQGRAVDYRIISANPSFEKHTGLKPDQILGQLASIAYGAGEAPYLEDFARVAQTGQAYAFETFFPPMQRHFQVSVTSPQRGQFVTVFEDITPRKKAERALRESREDLNRAQAVAQIGSWRLNVQKNKLTWSDENHRIFGIPPGTSMTYATFLDTVHPEDREYVDRDWMAALQGAPYDIEHRIIVDGRVKWVRERAELEFDSEGQLLGGFGTTQDITERKQVEGEIKRLASFPEMNPSPIIEIDLFGTVTYYNQAALKALEKKGPEAEWRDILPEDLEEIIAAFREKREAFFYREVKLNEQVFSQNIYFVELLQVLRIYSLNITKRHQAEEQLQRTLEDLERSNKDLEEFAYVASHDLQEPLRKIANFSEMLAKRYQGRLDDRADKYLGYIADGAKRMKDLINDLLTFSRVGRADFTVWPTDMKGILTGMLNDIHLLIREHQAEITHEPLPTLKVNPLQMRQLLQNLIVNAVKFHGSQPPRIHLSARPEGGEWVIAVRDNGIGFASEYAEGIFKVFRRLHTKEEYPGTGIGLAICKKIVERHGGRIWAESEPGSGATFYFTIPA